MEKVRNLVRGKEQRMAWEVLLVTPNVRSVTSLRNVSGNNRVYILSQPCPQLYPIFFFKCINYLLSEKAYRFSSWTHPQSGKKTNKQTKNTTAVSGK